MLNRYFTLIATFILVITFAACSDDDDNPVIPPSESTTNTFTVRIENIGMDYKFSSSGIFNTPTGAAGPGPLLPGNSYEYEFSAAPGSKLSFATMFVQSNDLFYAPDEQGIELFDGNGNQITGDITSQILLWDAGTEIDMEPGLGADQAPRQSGANSGAADPNNTVRRATDDFNNLPAVENVINVTLTSTGPTNFKLTIENVSNGATLSTSDGGSTAVPLAPGAWVVHTSGSPLFSAGQADQGNGLEGLAEDGNVDAIGNYLNNNTGLVTPYAPGVYVIHTNDAPLFTSGQNDRGEGLEALAEDGDPSGLNTSITGNEGIILNGVFNTPAGSASPGPIFKNGAYEFIFEASQGQRLSFATMLVQSNDLFIGTGQNGIELFNGGTALTGDITSSLTLWDAGTEINEEPGIGLNQAPRQSGPNTGSTENGTVRTIQNVNDGYTYPDVSDLVRVSISVQ